MQKFRITMTGKSPLLLHNARLSDPLDPATKRLAALTSKRKKTEDDHLAMAEAEFMGSLYLDELAGPYLPGDMITASLYRGAKLNKLGEAVKRGLLITTDVNPIGYQGSRNAVEMFRAGSFTHRASVKVGTQRVMRTRPVFQNWVVEADGLIEESQIELEDVAQIAENAGSFIGVGDWRPRFGRFDAKIEAL